MARNRLNKEQFMEKYAQSKSTYHRRIEELRKSEFWDAYIHPSTQEVWIDEDRYQEFLIWKSANRFKKMKNLGIDEGRW